MPEKVSWKLLETFSHNPTIGQTNGQKDRHRDENIASLAKTINKETKKQKKQISI